MNEIGIKMRVLVHDGSAMLFRSNTRHSKGFGDSVKMTQEKIHHVWMETKEAFFERIDAFGGWPIGKKFVSFFHNDKRECMFGNEYQRNEWYTTIADQDDYFLWKLSDSAKGRLRQEIKEGLISKLSRKDF